MKKLSQKLQVSHFAFAEGSPMAKLFTGLPRNYCPLMRVLDFFDNWLKCRKTSYQTTSNFASNKHLCTFEAILLIGFKKQKGAIICYSLKIQHWKQPPTILVNLLTSPTPSSLSTWILVLPLKPQNNINI